MVVLPTDRTRSRVRFRLAALAALGLWGCAGGPADEDPAPGEAAISTVEIESEHWSDVTVYAVHGGVRARLGTVTSMSAQTFRLPLGLGSGQVPISFLLDPIGSLEAYRLEPVSVAPGQDIRLRLAPELRHSAVSVH